MNKYQLCYLLWRCSLFTEGAMDLIQVSLVFLTLIHITCQEPLIFEDSMEFCSYSLGEKEKAIEMSSNTWSVKSGQKEINYRLCGKFTNKNICPLGTSACLKDHKSGKNVGLATEFALDENSNFKSINGFRCSASKNYSVVVSLHCLEFSKVIDEEDKCTYHVRMRDPKCPPTCSIYMYGKFFDLRDLGRSFLVKTDQRNFNVALCDKNPSCDMSDANACETIGDTKTAISLASSLSVSYIGQKNQLSFHGFTYKGENRKIDKKFEVILKCDWDKKDINNEDLKYVKKQTQGSKYTFQLETSFGCIKKPVSCVVSDQFLIYNLSGLYNEHPNMWSTHGAGQNKDSIYFLQICGPLEVEGKNASCKSTYAQVCENRNGIDINRGSVLRHLAVNGDVLKATIESGMQCKENPDLQYKTLIDFYCDKHEQGPKFLEQKSCDTYFTWKTPHACPYYNVSSCSHIHEHHRSCVYAKEYSYYNLIELANTTKSIRDGNKEFLFNICGPVIDSDAPCMKDVSVALKYLDEFNPKHKIISLGKFSEASMEKGSLVLKYSTGSFCNGTDYSSKIRFECGIVQEEPVILKQEKCFFEFLWKTKYACPGKVAKHVEDVKTCIYYESNTNKSVDFGSIDHSYIQLVDDNKFKYTFDICQRNYTNCTHNDDCNDVLIKNTEVKILHNLTSLKFTLPFECRTVHEFNKVHFMFKCDEIQNNEHIEVLDIANCSLEINYFTNIVCSAKEDYIPIEHYIPIEQVKQTDQPILSDVGKLPHQNWAEQTAKCFNKSPFTNQELHINNLKLEMNLFKKKCPSVTFNDTYRFVKLLYATTDVSCPLVPTKNLSYEVYLKCTNDHFISDVSDKCIEHYNDENLEYCSFFNEPSSQSMATGSIIGLTVGILLVTTFLLIVLSIVIKRKILSRPKYEGFPNAYQKNFNNLTSRKWRLLNTYNFS